ncbi:MAG: PH domain-containing protein [Acidimicrobiales bacterium]
MGYPTDQLHAREEVVLDLRPHWWFMSRQALALAGAIVIGIASLAIDNGPVRIIAGLLIVAAVIWFVARYIVWNTTNFVVTTDRLISRSGVLRREGVEIPLERINTVFFAQSIFERMIGSGDLRIESAGEMGVSSFSDIRRPLDVQNEIYIQMENNENRKFDRVAQGMQGVQAPAPAPVSIAEQIQQLDALRQQGLLTNEEFDQKKADLLRRM